MLKERRVGVFIRDKWYLLNTKSTSFPYDQNKANCF
jgi:hypothetical protein